MNGKKSIQKRSVTHKIISMFLLLFISVTGYIMSDGNPICYIGMAYASIKIILISRKHIIKSVKSMNRMLPMKNKITAFLFTFFFLSTIIGLYETSLIPPDYIKLSFVPKSNIYSNMLWKTRDVIIIQNHPIISFMLVMMAFSVCMFVILIIRFKKELMTLENIIERKSKEMFDGIIQKV